MIIIIGLPTMLVILGIVALFIVGSAVVYGIQSTWKGDTVAWLKPYTVKQKWGLFAGSRKMYPPKAKQPIFSIDKNIASKMLIFPPSICNQIFYR